MKLHLFDLDGTLLDSVKADDACFIQAFYDLYEIDLSQANWNEFTHVTDSGLFQEIFEKGRGRSPLAEELAAFKDLFFQLLAKRSAQFRAIPGALAYLQFLEKTEGQALAFATGGWRHTALLKTHSVGFALENYVLKTADDHISRTDIMRAAMEAALAQNQLDFFREVVYYGDGLWDLRATNDLGLDFIGVDHHQKGELASAGVQTVIRDFRELLSRSV